MSSNSSSPVEEKNFLTEDSADVPILAVTAELPVGQHEGDARPPGGGGGNPGAESETMHSHQPNHDIGPGAEPGHTGLGSPDGERAMLAAAALEELHLGQGDLAPVLDQSESMPSPFETTSHELEAVNLGATARSEDADSSPDVLTSAVLPMEVRDNTQPLEMTLAEEESASALDAWNLVIDADLEDDNADDNQGATLAAEPPTPGPQLGAVDEDFLRRVVLPPLPRDARPTMSSQRVSMGGESDDHTVISAPPSPELLASMAVAPRPPAAAPLALPQASGTLGRPYKRVRLTVPQFGVLMIGAIVLGAFLPGKLRAVLPRPVTSLLDAARAPAAPPSQPAPVAPERAAVEPAAVVASPPAPATTVTQETAPTVAPAATAPASEAVAAPPEAAPARPSPPTTHADATARPATKTGKVALGKRVRRGKRVAKKAFVDPFE